MQSSKTVVESVTNDHIDEFSAVDEALFPCVHCMYMIAEVISDPSFNFGKIFWNPYVLNKAHLIFFKVSSRQALQNSK